MISTRYWSNSDFAAWLRSTFKAKAKPDAASEEEWSEWNRSFRASMPVLYWITEDALDSIQNILYLPHDTARDIRAYLVNRFVSKTHVIRTGLKPGEYHEASERVIHGLFTELVNFIEVELAWYHCWEDSKAKAKYDRPSSWRMSEWRCPEAGLAYLELEAGLRYDETWNVDKDRPEYGQLLPNAIAAIEQRRLYDWWKNTRPKRPDPYDASGWSAVREHRHANGSLISNDQTDEDRAETKRTLTLCYEIERQYDEEDETMMIALIKLRGSLST